MRTWLKKLRHFMHTNLNHKFILGIEKCHESIIWFNPIPNLGTKIHHQYNLVDVHHKKYYLKYDPFILAVQVEQVCYTIYPTTRRNPGDY